MEVMLAISMHTFKMAALNFACRYENFVFTPDRQFETVSAPHVIHLFSFSKVSSCWEPSLFFVQPTLLLHTGILLLWF